MGALAGELGAPGAGADAEAECRRWGGRWAASLEALARFCSGFQKKKFQNADIFSSHSLLDYE